MDYEAECGCEYLDFHNKPMLKFCPLHEAAPDLLEALRELVLDGGTTPCWCGMATGVPFIKGHLLACKAAKAAIAKATRTQEVA